MTDIKEMLRLREAFEDIRPYAKRVDPRHGPHAINYVHVPRQFMLDLVAAYDAAEGLRPEVLAFAQLMESQLRANDHKPGWKNDLPGSLYERLCEESGELLRAMYYNRKQDVANEAADVANFAMMIADVCGALR